MHGRANNSGRLSILLVGDHCMQNQFLRREIEKSNKYKFTRKSIHDFSHLTIQGSFDIVLVSYAQLEKYDYHGFISACTAEADLIVYDVPNGIVELKLAASLNLKGMLYEDAPIEHLTRCIQAVENQELWLPRKVMEKMLSDIRPYAMNSQDISSILTKREKQILDRLVQGNSNLQIAEELFVAESTVKTHVYKLYKKLNVSNRKEAVQKASQPFHYEFKLH